MPKTSKKTLPIANKSYEVIKDYCKRNSFKISGWAEAILIKEIENEKSGTTTKNVRNP